MRIHNLIKKYPDLLRKASLEINDGWCDLIDDLCYNIQKYIDDNHLNQIYTIQVKEKFGGLRFYMDYEYDYVSALIDEAEGKSYRICIRCGSTNDVKRNKIYTLCKNCNKKF